MRPIASLIDGLLELTVIAGHTSIGYRARRSLFDWPELAGLDLSGRTYVVTGATRGIGFEATSLLLANGASVRSASRSADGAARAEQALRVRHPRADVTIRVADLSDPVGVATFADSVLDEHASIDGLAHCAGAYFTTARRCGYGVDATTGIYVLGPHDLTGRLLDALRSSPAPRIVFVASSGAYSRRFDIEALDPSPDEFRPLAAYAHAKRSQIVLTHAWHHSLAHSHDGTTRTDSDTTSIDAMTPGWCDTDLVREGLPRFRRVFRPILRSPAQGADTLVWLLVRGADDARTDRLWRDRHPRMEHRAPWTLRGDPPEQLWEWCEQRVAAARPAGPRTDSARLH